MAYKDSGLLLSETGENRNGYSSTVGTERQDCLSKILLANSCERSGQIDKAIALYREVVELDEEGTYRAIAQKALETLEGSEAPIYMTSAELETALLTSRAAKARVPLHRRLRQWFYNLPIRSKQLLGLFTSEVISVVGLVGIGSYLIIVGGRTQLLNQAESELTVAKINYNIKIDQMGFGFRGQSDNAAVIAAAKTHAEGEELDPELQSQVKQILENEISARKIEYATLVGRDRRIIVSANADRQGETFDPNGLVTKVLNDPQQIKISQIVSRSELEKEKPPLPSNFTREDALIRYTITPVKAPDTQSVLGVLVSGDIVNQKLPIVENTLEAFQGGYTAVYYYQPESKSFALATSLEEGGMDKLGGAQPYIKLPDTQLLAAAVAQPGKPVSMRLNLQGKSCSFIPLPWSPKCYTVAAKALLDVGGKPVALLVRGTPEGTLNMLLQSSLKQQGFVALIALLADVVLAVFLGRAIVRPIKKLQQVTQDFTNGNRQVRGRAIATDEIGELTVTFNQMADSIVASEAELAQQSRQQEAEAQKQLQAKESLQQEVMKLLLEIEGAQKGDLTVRGEVTNGVVGSIADAFNTTINKLSQLLLKVQTVSDEVNAKSQSGENSVRDLSAAALTQASEIEEALQAVAEIDASIQGVANSAQEAARIAHQALDEAQQGDTTMDRTVESIENIRSTVASNVKKVKQLAESSQEI